MKCIAAGLAGILFGYLWGFGVAEDAARGTAWARRSLS